MSDPVEQVTDKDVLAMMGALYVEVNLLRAKLIQAQQKIVELTPSGEPSVSSN